MVFKIRFFSTNTAIKVIGIFTNKACGDCALYNIQGAPSIINVFDLARS